MKKIFILSNDMNGGGAEKVLLTLLRNIPREDYQLTLGLVYRRGPHLEHIPPDIPVRYLFDDGVRGTTNLIRTDAEGLYQKIAPPDSDIEIAFLEGNATKILSKSRNAKAKKMAWVHIDLNLYHYTAPIYHGDEEELLTYQAFDRLVFVSQGAQAGFEARFGTTLQERSVVRYNPIDAEEIMRMSEAFPVPKRRLTLCASGRLVPEKGFQRLLDTVGKLQTEGSLFDLWILGDGPEQKPLMRQAAALPQKDAVSFWGFQNNPYPYMRTADIFVCSSLVEGYSLVIGEALILGRQVVATNCCGTREALQGGKYGILTDNDEEGLYRGLQAALNAVSSFGAQESKERFASYDMRLQLPRILSLFEEV